MLTRACSTILAVAAAAAALTACNDRSTPPTAVAPDHSAANPHAMHAGMGMVAATSPVEVPTPYTFRGAIDPFRIHQLPDFLMHSNTRSDVVMQRNIFNPGAGPWHTHPGISFIYVVSGQLRLDQVVAKETCVETPVYSAGAVYYEEANQVHRAVVVSTDPAVVLVTRFNIPLGGPVTIPAADPGC